MPQQKRKRGRPPEILKIQGDPEQALQRLFRPLPAGKRRKPGKRRK